MTPRRSGHPAERAWARHVVGDHEYRGRVGAPPDEIDDDLVGRATTGMANGDAGRDAFAAQTGVGRTIEDELDRDGGRIAARSRPISAAAGCRAAERRRQEIRPVDDESSRVRQRISGRGHRCDRTRLRRQLGAAATIGPWASSSRRPRWRRVPRQRARAGRGRGARRPGGSGRRCRLRHEQLDALPGRLRDPAIRDGLPGVRRPCRVVGPRDRVAYPAPRTVCRVLAFGASGLEREPRASGWRWSTGHAATRMHQEGIDGWAAAGAPDAVVTSLDPALTYLRLAAAADCIRAGARFIATNRDPVYPTNAACDPGSMSRRRSRRPRG